MGMLLGTNRSSFTNLLKSATMPICNVNQPSTFLSVDWSPLQVYTLFSQLIGPLFRCILFPLSWLVLSPGIYSFLLVDWSLCRLRSLGPKYVQAYLSTAVRVKRTLFCLLRQRPLLRLVLTLGIYGLPTCDWFSRWVYTASPPAIGLLRWRPQSKGSAESLSVSVSVAGKN